MSTILPDNIAKRGMFSYRYVIHKCLERRAPRGNAVEIARGDNYRN